MCNKARGKNEPSSKVDTAAEAWAGKPGREWGERRKREGENRCLCCSIEYGAVVWPYKAVVPVGKRHR